MKKEELEVGMKITNHTWGDIDWFKILYLGEESAFVEDENGFEKVLMYDSLEDYWLYHKLSKHTTECLLQTAKPEENVTPNEFVISFKSGFNKTVECYTNTIKDGFIFFLDANNQPGYMVNCNDISTVRLK